MIEEADQRGEQNDWRADPENPETFHRGVMRDLGLQRDLVSAIPQDIRQSAAYLASSGDRFMTWVRAMGLDVHEIQHALLKMASVAVERTNKPR